MSRTRWGWLFRVASSLLLALWLPAVAHAQTVLSAGAPALTQVVGDGDAFVENFEIWRFTIELGNSVVVGR